MLDEQFIFLGAGINLVAGIGYVIAVIRGRARPSRITWLVWALAGWVAFFGQVAQGVVMPAVLTAVVATVPTLIFLAACLRRGNAWSTSTLDWVCLAAAGCGIAVLFLVSGAAAIIAGIAVHALGAVPTVIKAYRAAESEAHIAYTAGMANAACTLLTLDQFTLDNAGFATYFLTLCSVISFLVLVRPRFMSVRSERTSPASPGGAGSAAVLAHPVIDGRPAVPRAARPAQAPSDNLLREAAAFAQEFAVVWTGRDPSRSRQRRERLARFFGGNTVELRDGGLLSALQGTQVVDHVFPGAVTPVASRALRVELRVGYTRFGHADPIDAAAAGSDGALSGGPSRWPTGDFHWQRMWVTVLRRHDGQLLIESGTVLAVDEPPTSSAAPPATEEPSARHGPSPAAEHTSRRTEPIGSRPVPPVPVSTNGQVKDHV